VFPLDPKVFKQGKSFLGIEMIWGRDCLYLHIYLKNRKKILAALKMTRSLLSIVYVFLLFSTPLFSYTTYLSDNDDNQSYLIISQLLQLIWNYLI